MEDEFKDELPPHDEKTECALVGCLVMAGCTGSQAQVDAILEGVRTGLFYCHFPRSVMGVIRGMRAEGHVVDAITLLHALKAKDYHPDSISQILSWQDEVPSVVHWTFYRDMLAELAKRRAVLKLAADASRMARDTTLDITSLRADVASILDGVVSEGSAERPRLVIRRSSERLAYHPPPGVDLIGTAEIRKGTEGVAILAGPGSSGKSLMVGTLALAGAIGSGTWMGRKVHRKFKTLIIQGEVGPTRLKLQIQEFRKNHPDADIEGSIYYSDPPEFGFAIEDSLFWRELAKTVAELKPDLVVIDPISHLSVEDQSSEVMNAIRIIRQAVGVGDDAPGILLVAHTKKPRSEEAMRGRNLANIVSGSVAWVNTSRCTFLCVPFDADDIEDDRIYFATPKLNDGPNYAPTVWHRRFGTFFRHDPDTDPRMWGREKSEDERAQERQRIGKEDIEVAFGDRLGMKRAELVRALVAAGHDEATCYRATKEPDGYLMKYLHVVAGVYGMK